MPTQPVTATPDYSHLTQFQQIALQTRARKQAAGKYPTKAQKEAFKRLVARDGYRNLTVADMRQLAAYPHFTESQRRTWGERADAAEAALAAE